MFGSIFTTLIVQPIFNFLVALYALLPGHNFGLAIILFTVIVRFLMYPMVRKQLFHGRAMRALQPELKRIKKEAAGDRQKESALTMALYKERQINPFSSIGLLIVQIPLFLALYSSLNRIVQDPRALVDFSYTWVRDLSWIKTIAADISQFDNTLFGFVDLSRSAIGKGGSGIYWPAMFIAIASTYIQFKQMKQTMPTDSEARSIKQILKEANGGKTADQAEVNTALSRNMSYIFPILIFFLTVGFAAALSLYWLVGGLVGYLQQAYLLKRDEEILKLENPTPEKAKLAGAKEAKIIESEPSQSKTKKAAKAKPESAASKRKKRR